MAAFLFSFSLPLFPFPSYLSLPLALPFFYSCHSFSLFIFFSPQGGCFLSLRLSLPFALYLVVVCLCVCVCVCVRLYGYGGMLGGVVSLLCARCCLCVCVCVCVCAHSSSVMETPSAMVCLVMA